jgi:hypothetical protein
MTDTEILDELQRAINRTKSERRWGNKWDITFGTIHATLYPEADLRLILKDAIKNDYARRVARELSA